MVSKTPELDDDDELDEDEEDDELEELLEDELLLEEELVEEELDELELDELELDELELLALSPEPAPQAHSASIAHSNKPFFILDTHKYCFYIIAQPHTEHAQRPT